MLTLIGSKGTRTRRVIWALEELELAYEHQPHPPRSAEATRLNPSGKVPILIDGDAVITDSTAILHYLADRHGCLTFPAGTPERARQDGFTFRILDEIEGPLWTAARHSFVLPEEHRLPAIKDSLKWEFDVALKRLGKELGDGPFLMGEVLTVADIVLAHCLGWAEQAGFPVDAPGIADFLARMRARPAAVKAYS